MTNRHKEQVRHLALQLVVALGDATDNGSEVGFTGIEPSAGVVKSYPQLVGVCESQL